MNPFESDIANDVYDILFENDHNVIDFAEVFPGSEVDVANARITLKTEDGTEYTLQVTKTYSGPKSNLI
jgi:hypothetical protein